MAVQDKQAGDQSRSKNSHYLAKCVLKGSVVLQAVYGHIRSPTTLDVVFGKETALELVVVSEDGMVQSVCEQTVFGTIKDLAVLPWNDNYRAPQPQTYGKDLLVVLSDSGKLSFLTFSVEMHRFLAVAHIHLSQAGNVRRELGRLLAIESRLILDEEKNAVEEYGGPEGDEDGSFNVAASALLELSDSHTSNVERGDTMCIDSEQGQVSSTSTSICSWSWEPDFLNNPRLVLCLDAGEIFTAEFILGGQDGVKIIVSNCTYKCSPCKALLWTRGGFIVALVEMGDGQVLKIEEGVLSCRSLVQNISPILDIALVDYHNEKQDQMFACCGMGQEGSLRIIRNGVSVEKLLSTLPIYQGMTGTWIMRMKRCDSYHSFLVISFVEETRVLSVGLNFVDITDAVGFQPNACTLACGIRSESSCATLVSWKGSSKDIVEVEMVHTKRLNVQKLLLRSTPRRVLYHSESKTLLVMRTECSEDDSTPVSYICCVDPLSGSLLSKCQIDRGETARCMQLWKVGNDQVLVVGTGSSAGRAIMPSGEAESSKGRLLIFQLEPMHSSGSGMVQSGSASGSLAAPGSPFHDGMGFAPEHGSFSYKVPVDDGLKACSRSNILLDGADNTVVASTLLGSVVIFIQLTREEYDLLEAVQARLASYPLTAPVLGNNHAQFRGRGSPVGVCKVLDGDMLAQFLELTSTQQQAVLAGQPGLASDVANSVTLQRALPADQVLRFLERVHNALN